MSRASADTVLPCVRSSRIRFASALSSVSTMPPSPVVMLLRGWKLMQLVFPNPPSCFSPTLAPSAHAASSITFSPYSFAIAFTLSISQHRPNSCTGTMPHRVFPVSLLTSFPFSFRYFCSMISCVFSVSMLKVSRRISVITGVAPVATMLFSVATNVNAGAIASIPALRPSATIARCSAVVQLVVATPSATPSCAAICFSNSVTRGPCATQPEASASAAICASSSVK